MNKEQQELLGAAYKRYHTVMNSDEWIENWVEPGKKRDDARKNKGNNGYTKEEFINEIKTDDEFSERWGLKIEERELSSDERYNLLSESEKKNFIITMRPMMSPDDKYDEVHYTIDNYYEHIPKRAITITYNDKTIESYE